MKSIQLRFNLLILALVMGFFGSTAISQTIVEDFETGDFSSLNWQFEGTPSMWEIEELSLGDGTYSASANAVAFNDHVYMSVTRTFTEPGQITFDVQQTESNIFIFEIEGVSSMYTPGWIVGPEIRTESYDLPAGTYTITFGSYNIGVFGEPFTMKDSLFIDNITFPNQPFTETAVVQVIHNSADPLAEVVDIYIDNEIALDNFTFKSNTPFIDFPAGEEITLSVKGANSTPADPAIWSQNYTLDVGERYILIADGLVGDPSGFDPYIPFDIAVYPIAEQNASALNVNILVHHGSTDAPIVDIIETGVGAGLLVEDLSYGNYSSYLEVPVDNYQLSIYDETGSSLLATFYAPLNDFDLGGTAITVIASGFLNPSANSNGPGFGLFVATPDTTALIELPVMSDLEGNIETFESGDFLTYNWRFEGDNPNSWQIITGGNGTGSFAAKADHDGFNEYQTMFLYGDFEENGILELDMFQTENSITIIEVGDISIAYSQFNPIPEWETISIDIQEGVQRISITNYVIGIFGQQWTIQEDSVLIDNIRFNAGDQGNNNTARVQVIHNSADAAAEVVDVWLDDNLLIDNFAFRTASPFIDAPAGEEFTIAIQGPDSSSPENPIWSQNYTLAEDETYILVAEGIVSPNGYNPATPFDIAVYDMGREQASISINTDVLVHHGSTDVPAVDVYETLLGVGEIVNDLMYAGFDGYLELPTVNYILEVRDESGVDILAAYEAPLAAAGLQGAAVTVLASGFLNPNNNSNGPAFGLYVALPAGGELIQLPEASINPNPPLLLNPEQDNTIFQVPDNNSNGFGPNIFVGTTNSNGNARRGLMQFSFADIPEGAIITDVSLSLYCFNQSQSGTSSNYDLHRLEESWGEGSSISPNGQGVPATPGDATWINRFYDDSDPVAWLDEGGTFNSIPSASLPVNEENQFYTWTSQQLIDDVQNMIDSPDENNGWILKASDESINGLGRVFGSNTYPVVAFRPLLYVEYTTGVSTARVQVMHNSADAAAEVVDVWLNDALLLDNFAFRTASPFVDAPAGEEFTIAIQGPNSSSPENPIWSQNYTLEEDETYILVADGIVSASGYDPAPAFDIAVYAMGREMASMMENTDVLVHHGSTDSPTVDVYETGVGAGEIVNDLMYTDFAGYLELGTMDYVLEIRDETGQNTIAAYEAPLATLGLEGAALTVVASGFLNPENNSNGPAFGLWVALPSGGELIPLPLATTTGFDERLLSESLKLYPNPANSFINVNLELEQTLDIRLEMIDISGRTYNSIDLGSRKAINNYKIDVSSMAKGIYFVKVNAGSFSHVRKVIITD